MIRCKVIWKSNLNMWYSCYIYCYYCQCSYCYCCGVHILFVCFVLYSTIKTPKIIGYANCKWKCTMEKHNGKSQCRNGKMTMHKWENHNAQMEKSQRTNGKIIMHKWENHNAILKTAMHALYFSKKNALYFSKVRWCFPFISDIPFFYASKR